MSLYSVHRWRGTSCTSFRFMTEVLTMKLAGHTRTLALRLASLQAAVLVCQTCPLSLWDQHPRVSWLSLHAVQCKPCEELPGERAQEAAEQCTLWACTHLVKSYLLWCRCKCGGILHHFSCKYFLCDKEYANKMLVCWLWQPSLIKLTPKLISCRSND